MEIILGIVVNIFVGAAVCASLDTNERFLNWMRQDPTGGIISFVAVSLWPIMAYYMIRYKIEKRRWNYGRKK